MTKSFYRKYKLSPVCLKRWKIAGIQHISTLIESWIDAKLYEKYGLTEEEIAFIESMIKPMELGGDDDGN